MPTEKQKRAIKKVVENHGNVSKSMREAGYSEKSAKNPKNLTESKAWKDLMEEYLPDEDLASVHKRLLNSTGIGHMVFPTAVSDKEIKSLLATVNCIVKKIQHGDQANHVWFWAPDNKARKDGLDMAYKLKGHYAPERKEHSGINGGPIEYRELTDEQLNAELEKRKNRIPEIIGREGKEA